MIDRKTLERVAALARIELDPGQVEGLLRDLDRILGYVDQLGRLDVDSVPPLTHAAGGHDVYRKDEPGPSLPRKNALQNAPDRDEGFYRVPRVIEGE